LEDCCVSGNCVTFLVEATVELLPAFCTFRRCFFDELSVSSTKINVVTESCEFLPGITVSLNLGRYRLATPLTSASVYRPFADSMLLRRSGLLPQTAAPALSVQSPQSAETSPEIFAGPA
jgi:hypothetical protein